MQTGSPKSEYRRRNGKPKIDLFVGDLLRFIDDLEIDKTVLCGLSMGGYIELNAIGNHPERFEALILSDTNCIADSPEAKEKRFMTIESIRENGFGKYADESIKKIKGSSLHIIGQAGHLSNMENPLEFIGQLKKFLTSVYSKKIKSAGKWKVIQK